MAIEYSDQANYLSKLDQGVGLLVFYTDWLGPRKNKWIPTKSSTRTVALQVCRIAHEQ